MQGWTLPTIFMTVALKFLLSYSNRNASGEDGASADFSRFDFGGALSLNAQF